MKKPSPNNRFPTRFFLLTFFLSLPFYILNALAYERVLGRPEIGAIYIALFTFTPILAASFLTFRTNGYQGLKALLAKTFDWRKIKKSRWYFAIVLLQPLLFLLSLVSLVLLGFHMPPSLTPLMALPVVIPFIFLLAAGEEVGWMGYAFEPMEKRFGTLKAVFVLGIIWAFWHLPFFMYIFPDPFVLTSQFLTLIAGRVLLVWIFCNTGRSVFGSILFHASGNAAMVAFPEIQALVPWGSIIYFAFILGTASIVTLLWRRSGEKQTKLTNQ
ncbi:CPBP family intramembrane glutamic endopeptidase [Poritiphilus flavus]|uniref:CPBP family intramembrane metalloprotease n=1 Tax=Poritiphilus flavus TaxID=2697053 RepID=A0A6L9EGL0_9FLAO|nr:CPBP family intramembrane glutamic endopeptidase [Poritiphilus flavus]NAS13831.1 CPBP family intramembrane metalloprotease [Poritiphilus flavus]